MPEDLIIKVVPSPECDEKELAKILEIGKIHGLKIKKENQIAQESFGEYVPALIALQYLSSSFANWLLNKGWEASWGKVKKFFKEVANEDLELKPNRIKLDFPDRSILVLPCVNDPKELSVVLDNLPKFLSSGKAIDRCIVHNPHTHEYENLKDYIKNKHKQPTL